MPRVAIAGGGTMILMVGNLLERARVEDGAASISGLLVLGAAVVFLYALLGASNVDPDRYGRMAVPSEAIVALPADEIDIYYLEAPPRAGARFDRPSDLEIKVVDPATNTVVRTGSRGGVEELESGEVAVAVATVTPPREDNYRVRASSDEARVRVRPQLGFGDTPAGAVGDRLGNVGDLITSGWGIAVGAMLLGALIWPSLRRELKRRS